jgi:predicted nucleotidyltransferase
VSATQSGRASPRATEPINRTWVVPWLDSDVDLLVTWSEGASLLDHAALMLELEKLLGRKVDIASDGWVKPAIQESVYRDAIAI